MNEWRLRVINHIHIGINLGHKVTLVKPELWKKNKKIGLSQLNTNLFYSRGYLEFQFLPL